MDLMKETTAVRRFYYRQCITKALAGATHEDAMACVAVIAGCRIAEHCETPDATTDAVSAFAQAVMCCAHSHLPDEEDDLPEAEVH